MKRWYSASTASLSLWAWQRLALSLSKGKRAVVASIQAWFFNTKVKKVWG
jgi:hypothetical protein